MAKVTVVERFNCVTKTLTYPAVRERYPPLFRKLLQSTPVGKHDYKIEVQAW